MSNENAEFREEMRRTTTELQQELNSLKNEVRALKNHNVIVDQSVALNLTPVQPTGSTTNTLLSRIPRRPACTFSQGDADKPCLSGYIRETMNLVKERDESEIVKMRKTENTNSALCNLEGMEKTVCGAMANAVSQDPSLDKTTAKQFNFHLDRSVGDWASLLLLSSSYHNNYKPKKPHQAIEEQNLARSSGNVEQSIEQPVKVVQWRASAEDRRRSLNESQLAQQSTRPQMRRKKQ
ncbi:hypothetical protein G6F56_012041 [Rhizopus delemar]|nr:hypothetical protein G6F56_012041 [Rhizopus delemar]